MEATSRRETGLASAYDALKDQFKTVNRVLRDTNIKLNSKVGELDVLTYYLNSILSHISQGLLFITLDGNVTTCNAAAEEMLGIENQKVMFLPFSDNFRDDLFGFSMKEALSKKNAPKKSFIFFESAQGRRELEVESTFVFQKDTGLIFSQPLAADSLQGLIILIRDVTDLHRLQNLANRNDRMKALGEMAAMVAHEVRNPLGGIKGYASLLQRDLKNQPDLQQLAGYIIEGTDNLNRLVTNVLNYARPLQISIETTDLVTVLKEITNHVQADMSLDARIHLVLNFTVETLPVPIDVQLFKSAVLNLIVNAVQAMPDGGNITLSLSKDKEHAIIKVADAGIGIPEENLKKIFTPFFTTKATGNGFGLAEVDHVIRAHGGIVEVSSKVGQGTTFTIKLPFTR